MFANLKIIPKKYESFYITYMICLLTTFLALALLRPNAGIIIFLFLMFFAIDSFFLSKSEEKILLPLLVDLFIYGCWFIIVSFLTD